MAQSQLNIRLSQAAFDAIEAAVYVRRLRSPQQLVGPAVETLAAELASDPAVAAAMRVRESEQEASNVRHLARKSKRPG